MADLPTVVLHHQRGRDSHYDWLLGDPPDAAQTGPLVTWRSAQPPSQWAAGTEHALTLLPPHRRRYLQYEGPISDQRGRVRRVASGRAQAELWTEDHRIVRLDWPDRTMRIELIRREAADWIGRVLAD